MFKNRLNRRNFLQQTGLWAAAAAAGSLPNMAYAARDKELNIYCWEGYNSDEVLDPFRREFDAKVRAEGLTSDPDAVNRLRAGETAVWDLINVNNPWAREMMYPEGLIRPLPRERFEPMFEKMMPAFHPPYEWAMDKSGQELLGMTQRFGPFNFVVNTDKISRAMAEDEGFNIFLDPAMNGRYGILTYDNWNIYHMCVTAGVHPFKAHTAEEIAAFTDACKKIFNGAKLLTDDLVQMNLALINGEIDAYFTGGTYTASPGALRRRDAGAWHHPEIGSDGRQGRHRLDRADLRGQQSGSVAAGRRVPGLCPTSGHLQTGGIRRGHLQSGVADGRFLRHGAVRHR